MNQKEIKKICIKCKAVCCKLGGAEFTKKEMQRVLKAGYSDYFRKVGRNHYETKTRKGVCAYLKNNVCSIQGLKPKMCWAWPVDLDFNKHHKIFNLIECPLTQHLSKKEIIKMKKQMRFYNQDFIDCDNTKMSKKEVGLVMKKYYKFNKKRFI
jgi:Fe-S-cluster containining protein